jgi:two-component system, response regulator RegA
MARLRDFVEQALVLEDDELLGATLVDALARHDLELRWYRTLRETRACLHDDRAFRPGLLVLDVMLPDGTSVDLLRELERSSALPAVVAISGEARPEHSFDLAQLGVECFVPKPIELAALEAAFERALRQPIELRPFLRKLVGKRSIGEVETEVRATMVREAMARGRSVSGAARLLSVSRQLLQHILRDLE